MNLSKHVTLAEFEASGTATNHSILNKMNEFEIERAKLLCEKVFEPLRAHMGEPIRINSGFRSIATNKACGGSKTSQHYFNQTEQPKWSAPDRKLTLPDMLPRSYLFKSSDTLVMTRDF